MVVIATLTFTLCARNTQPKLTMRPEIHWMWELVSCTVPINGVDWMNVLRHCIQRFDLRHLWKSGVNVLHPILITRHSRVCRQKRLLFVEKMQLSRLEQIGVNSSGKTDWVRVVLNPNIVASGFFFLNLHPNMPLNTRCIQLCNLLMVTPSRKCTSVWCTSSYQWYHASYSLRSKHSLKIVVSLCAHHSHKLFITFKNFHNLGQHNKMFSFFIKHPTSFISTTCS